MNDFMRNLLWSDFMPHGHCYRWQPEIVWLHAISDGLIALSYYLIPVTLFYFVRKRSDLPFHWMFLMFGIFILGCGTTHAMEVWTLWHGTYRVAGVIKAVTAVASVATAGLLVLLLPQALALPSPAQLRAANDKLEGEIVERRRAEAALAAARDELEVRVQERTAELAGANDALRDEIDRRQKANQDLSKLQTELAHVVRVTTMGELAASIAHEVNQPLTAIITNANACLRWLAGDRPNLEEARESVARIRRDGKRAAEVVRRVRALLKKDTPQVAPQDVNELIREVLALVDDALLARRVSVELELMEGMSTVPGDRVQLQQVILNLVMNGVEAMNDVTDRPRMLVVHSRLRGANEVEISVHDCGVGIDAANMERLFDPFYTTKSSGMGMGLSVSRSIVESHGGRLWASANVGPGTTFHFTLPVTPVM